jgi:hypothetical protein
VYAAKPRPELEAENLQQAGPRLQTAPSLSASNRCSILRFPLKTNPIQNTEGAPGLFFETWDLLRPNSDCFVSGHGFSRAENATKRPRALQAAEELDALKGTGFSPYINPAKRPRALAPEVCFSSSSSESKPFSAPVQPPHNSIQKNPKNRVRGEAAFGVESWKLSTSRPLQTRLGKRLGDCQKGTLRS